MILAAGVLSYWKVADPDVFWHLKAGIVMWERGRLLSQNTFSSAFPSYPWQNNEWLFQLLLAGVYRAGGWAGIAAFKLAAVVALGGLIFGVIMRRAGRPLLAAAGAVTALAIMQHRLTERPHLLSYLFFAIVVLVLARRERHPKALLALPLLYALWSNAHPEVIFGLFYLGLVAAGEALDSRGAPSTTGAWFPAGVRRLLLATLLCAGATLVNPWGYHLLVLPFGAFGRPDITITEFGFSSFGLFASFWVLLAGALALLLARSRRTWSELLPVLAFGALAVLFQRVIPFFLLVAVPAAFGAAAEFSGAERSARRRRVDSACALVAYAALVWALGFERPGLYRWGWGVNEEFYPAAAADLLAAEPWRGNLYNPYRGGGYLIYRLYPRLGVLQDGRGGVSYPREFMRRMNRDFTPADLPRIMADYGITVALFNREEVGAHFDRTRWGVVFWDDAYCVLVRRDSPNRDLLERLEYRFFLPGVDADRAASPDTLGAFVREMERNQAARRSPSAPLANSIGFLYIRSGDRVAAERLFRGATRIDEAYAPAWANLGILLSDSGRTTEAAAALSRALALDGGLHGARSRLAEIDGRPAGAK